MTRWISPVDSTGRYSDGWWPRLAWPYCIYGNLSTNFLDLRTLAPVGLDALDPMSRSHLLELPRGNGVPVPDDAISGVVDGVMWVWVSVEIGANEQVFAIGRPVSGAPGDVDGIVVEMPVLDLQAHYDETSRTWTLAGSAMGNHGTPDYRDGELHVVRVPADTPMTTLASHVTRFAFPIRLPLVVNGDVWTFGDEVTGTVGGGASSDRPNRQGIGLWPDGRPWLDRAKPVLGVWTSPYDAAQGLRHYPQVSDIADLVDAYGVPEVKDAVIGLYLDERQRGGWNMDAIEETIAVAVCRQTGCSLTVYDDHALMEVPGSEGTRYRPELLQRMYGLQAQGLGVACGMRVYPDGQAGWALQEAMRAIIAGDAAWLGLPEAKPMPVVLTLALYTQAGNWAPTGVARRLEEMVRIGESERVLCYDVFGVKRGGEGAEWNAWADEWLSNLLASTAPLVESMWPRTTVAAEAPAPVVPVDLPVLEPRGRPREKPGMGTGEKVSLGATIGGSVAALLLWWRDKRKGKKGGKK